MSIERRVKVFRNGRNLAVRIPREFEGQFEEGRDAVMSQENGTLVVKPMTLSHVLDFLKTLDPVEDDFPEIDDPPPIDDVDL